jgi:hypothetical protein
MNKEIPTKTNFHHDQCFFICKSFPPVTGIFILVCMIKIILMAISVGCKAKVPFI